MNTIPMMKQFSIEELLDVLDSTHQELRHCFYEYQEESTFKAAQNVQEVHDFLMAEYIINNYPNQIH